MLSWIIDWSLRNRPAVIMIWALVALGGVISAVSLPLDAFPDTTPVQVQVNTVAPALGPEEVEKRITVPIELAISGLKGLELVRSISKFGLSQVTVVFRDGTDIHLARQLVLERLHDADLPEESARPRLGPVATGMGEVFHYLVRPRAVSVDEAALTDALTAARTEQDWTLKQRLRRVEGAAEVNSWGGFEKQVVVAIDPHRMLKYGVTLDDVALALDRNNRNVGGGSVRQAGEAVLVQGIGRATGPADVREIVIKSVPPAAIRIRDVADVAIGHEIRRGAVTEGGRGEAILGLGFVIAGENPREVTERFRRGLGEAAKALPEDVVVETLYDRTDLVSRVIRTVETNLLEGALLVVAVVFIFLGHARAGFIVALAIPLSMLFAASLMLRFGIAASLMSLGAIDFGLVVDSSVIQVENAARHLALPREGRTVEEVVRGAAVEVRKPTLYGEVIIAIVYLPVLTLEGIEGKLFRPMALTVIFALAGSLALSLTLVPALTSLLLGRSKLEGEHEPRIVRWAKAAYAPVLALALRRRGLVLAAAAAILAGAGFLAPRLGAEFVPRLSEGAIAINTVRLAGVSLEESVRYGTMIERAILDAFPDEVERVWTRTGTAEVATDPMGIELSDVFVTLAPRERWRRARDQAALVEAMSRELADLPGMRVVFSQPIEMRVNEMIAGVRTDIGVKVFGESYDDLRAAAASVEAVLKSIPGAADVFTEQVTGLPVLEVEVDRAALARYGVPAAEVLEIVEAIGGRKVGEVVEGDRRFPLVVRLPEAIRDQPSALGTLLVTTPRGERIPLARLAKVRRTEGPSQVNREWAKRRIVVSANVRGRDVGSFVAEARRRVEAEVPLPTGLYVEWGGQFEHLERASRRLAIVVPLALLLVFVLLYATYGTITDSLRVFTGVPFAAVGGIAALYLRDLPFSVSAGVGFIALSGVSVLGDMVLVSQIKRLLADGEPLDAAIRGAALQRLRPVLMTSLVAAFGFLPMALSTSVGAEVQRPLATVVIGGLLSSTALTLIVLPVLYSLFGGTRGER